MTDAAGILVLCILIICFFVGLLIGLFGGIFCTVPEGKC